MRATLLFCLVAIAAVAVTAQGTVSPAPAAEEYSPAIMTPPPAGLKKPIIFDPTPAAGSPDADAPLTGKAPAHLKPAAVTEHIYGGVVEFARGRTPQGCRCRKQLPEKHRYDILYKRANTTATTTPCGCPAAPAPKPEDKLPPVIARLYPIRTNVTLNATAPCAANVTAPVVQKIAPSYYPKGRSPRALARLAAKQNATAPCPKPVAAPQPTTITPSFYPTRAERRARRKARKAKKAAAAKKF